MHAVAQKYEVPYLFCVVLKNEDLYLHLWRKRNPISSAWGEERNENLIVNGEGNKTAVLPVCGLQQAEGFVGKKFQVFFVSKVTQVVLLRHA